MISKLLKLMRINKKENLPLQDPIILLMKVFGFKFSLNGLKNILFNHLKLNFQKDYGILMLTIKQNRFV